MAKAPDVSLDVVGGILDYDGSGWYPGLELFNFVFGTEELLPKDEKVRVTRRAHDFARRLVWDSAFSRDNEGRDVLFDQSTEEALRHLLACLQMEIPSTAKTPTWERAHFFPYTRSLIHWDARKRGQKIRMERRYLRGGGALAFHVLRMDLDASRLERCRKGFSGLFPHDGGSSLEELAAVLASHGVFDPEPTGDEVEPRSRLFSDDGLDELYRNGTVNILEHSELSAVARVRALMVWTAFWLLLAQHVRSSRFLGQPASRIVCDCSSSRAQLRRASQRCLRDLQATILEAAGRAAARAGDDRSLSRQQKSKLRGFFWATAATIGLLNAWKGRRHFVLGLDILETLVLAGTQGQEERSFDQFIDDWLFEDCRLVVGTVAGRKSELFSSFDASVFEENENALAGQMKAAGLLTEYSDATRMISTQGLS
jgi:hypothetical protein